MFDSESIKDSNLSDKSLKLNLFEFIKKPSLSRWFLLTNSNNKHNEDRSLKSSF